MMARIVRWVLFGMGWVMGVPSHSMPEAPAIQVSGFATLGVSVSDNEVPYGILSANDHINFVDGTILGLQLETKIDDRLRFSSQLIANNQNDRFDVNAEWLYGAYKADNRTTVRVGRLRVPSFAISNYFYVGYSYLWAYPVDEVYVLMPFTRYSGADVLHSFDWRGYTFTVQPWVGSVDTATDVFDTEQSIKSNAFWGTAIRMEGENLAVRSTYSKGNFDLDLGSGRFDTTQAEFFSVGFNYRWHAVEFIGEYAGAQFEHYMLSDNDSAYTTIAYHLGSYVPSVTVANIKTDSGLMDLDSSSVAVALRYDVSTRWAVKGQWRHAKAKKDSTGLFFEQPDDNRVNVLTFNVTMLF